MLETTLFTSSTEDTKLIKLYWSYLFDILIVRQFLSNQSSDRRMLNGFNMLFVLQTITVQRHCKLRKIEKNGSLCLFVNLVPSASFRYKRKASKMGGDLKGDFKSSNFSTFWWIGKNLEVAPRLVFKKPNITSLSWIGKNWEIQLEQHLKIPKSLCELETI